MMLQLLLSDHIDFILYPCTSFFDMIHFSGYGFARCKLNLCVDFFLDSGGKFNASSFATASVIEKRFFIPLLSRRLSTWLQ